MTLPNAFRPAALNWAGELVAAAIDELVPEAEEYAADTESERLQNALLRVARRLPKDEAGYFSRRDLIENTRGRGRSHRDVKSELEGLIDAGALMLKIVEGDGGVKRPASPIRYRLRER